jgi:glycosyltransferase involved in cell wall biosynthesis
MDLSVVIPAYNEEESVQELAEWIHRVCYSNNISYEIIFIDDGSSDSTWQKIADLSVVNNSVK